MHHPPYYLQKGHLYAVPIIHYNMEMAAQVKMAIDQLKPDCIAVELPETMQSKMLHAASRLPDISLILTYQSDLSPLYFMCEPCDPIFEALRSASESQIDAYCIDLDIEGYPQIRECFPDPYAIHRIGLKIYYEMFIQTAKPLNETISLDRDRELHMARRLKELTLRYDKVLFIGGMQHISSIFDYVSLTVFPELKHTIRDAVELCTLTAESSRDAMAEWGYLTKKYEEKRDFFLQEGPPDRQVILYQLYREAAEKYVERTGHEFPGYHLRNLMKFNRNYALTTGRLLPNLFQILTSAKGCVDHDYAYEVWELATDYPHRHNIDQLLELDLTIEDIWGSSKSIHFHIKEKRRKHSLFQRQKKNASSFKFLPPNPFTICSYPPEDIAIENFGNFLKRKGVDILSEEGARTIAFSTSIEDGIDTRETIRHWHEKKLYVKTKGKPPSGVGSICMIFDEDQPEEGKIYKEKFSWCTTWLGEHQQESDMAFYATPLTHKVVGPGISRCEYGGFMMSYPPRRMNHVWSDPDYSECRTKAEILLMAAIDYAIKPIIVYVSSSPPRKILKNFAARFGKRIVYLPIGQLSPITLNKLRAFHVLDSHDKRSIADEYIY
ncbi:MAG: hypothetical protein ACH350_06225 [Parachlamydiaceae bacterium]